MMRDFLTSSAIMLMTILPSSLLAQDKMIVRMAISGTPVVGGQPNELSISALSISVAVGEEVRGDAFGSDVQHGVATWAYAGPSFSQDAASQEQPEQYVTQICETACSVE